MKKKSSRLASSPRHALSATGNFEASAPIYDWGVPPPWPDPARMSFITTPSEGNFGSMQQISIDEAHNIMAKRDKQGNLIPFEVEAVTCDLERNTGGERITYKATLAAPGGNRKAYHHRNDTRRILLVDSGEYRTISPILMTKINGKEIYI